LLAAVKRTFTFTHGTPCGSNGASRSEYLLEAVPLRFIRLPPGHKSGQATDAYTHASQKNLQEIRIPFDEL